MKTKIKSFGDKVTDTRDKEIPMVDSNCTFFFFFSLDFVLKEGESYYPQVFLNECKYIEKIVVRNIIDDLKVFLMILMKNKLKIWS